MYAQERIQKENEEAAAAAAALAKEEAEAKANEDAAERERRGNVRVWMDIALAEADQRLSKASGTSLLFTLCMVIQLA